MRKFIVIYCSLWLTLQLDNVKENLYKWTVATDLKKSLVMPKANSTGCFSKLIFSFSTVNPAFPCQTY